MSCVSPSCYSTLDLDTPLIIFLFGQSTTSTFPLIALSPASLGASQVPGWSLSAIYKGLGTSSPHPFQGHDDQH